MELHVVQGRGSRPSNVEPLSQEAAFCSLTPHRTDLILSLCHGIFMAERQDPRHCAPSTKQQGFKEIENRNAHTERLEHCDGDSLHRELASWCIVLRLPHPHWWHSRCSLPNRPTGSGSDTVSRTQSVSRSVHLGTAYTPFWLSSRLGWCCDDTKSYAPLSVAHFFPSSIVMSCPIAFARGRLRSM